MTVYDSGVVLGFLIGLAVLIACIVWIVKDVLEIRRVKRTIKYLTSTDNEDYEERFHLDDGNDV